jgi:MSHA pilin protein MshD
MRRRSRHSEGGFTLVEALLASTILAATISAITLPFTTAANNQAYDGACGAAVALAEEMMEEILSKPFHDPDGASAPGPEGDEPSRSHFDNVDDYDDYSEDVGAVVDSDGNVASDTLSAGLSRTVSADYVYVSGQDTSCDPTFVRVTVEVQRGGQPIITLCRLIYDLQ